MLTEVVSSPHATERRVVVIAGSRISYCRRAAFRNDRHVSLPFSHPDVYMSDRKEMHFFGADLEFWSADLSPQSRRLFGEYEGRNGERRAGEASVWYLLSKLRRAKSKHSIDANSSSCCGTRLNCCTRCIICSVTTGNEHLESFEEALAAEELRRRGQMNDQANLFAQGLGIGHRADLPSRATVFRTWPRRRNSSAASASSNDPDVRSRRNGTYNTSSATVQSVPQHDDDVRVRIECFDFARRSFGEKIPNRGFPCASLAIASLVFPQIGVEDCGDKSADQNSGQPRRNAFPFDPTYRHRMRGR